MPVAACIRRCVHPIAARGILLWRPPSPSSLMYATSAHQRAAIYAVYQSLNHEQLVLFANVRGLGTDGSDTELAQLLTEHDDATYLRNPAGSVPLYAPPSPAKTPEPLLPSPSILRCDLPVEVVSEIVDKLGDWELSKAIGLPTSLAKPVEWRGQATSLDEAFLRGYVSLIWIYCLRGDAFTRIGVLATVRFQYTGILEYLLVTRRATFLETIGGDASDLIPVRASHLGCTEVLSWWRNAINRGLLSPSTAVTTEAVDGAARNGRTESLDWWLSLSLPVNYTAAALEHASSRNHIHVLRWWRTHASKLPMKVGRVLECASASGAIDALDWWAKESGLTDIKYDRLALYHASCHGRLDVLDWWAHQSGLQLIFDPDVLIGATRHDRPEVLDWWDRSGLAVQYRLCDIEEALEDAIRHDGEHARRWWLRKGVRFSANDAEWLKLRNLN